MSIVLSASFRNCKDNHLRINFDREHDDGPDAQRKAENVAQCVSHKL